MKNSNYRDMVVVFVVVWSVVGFPAIALSSNTLGFLSTTPSIVMRSITLALAIFFIFSNFEKIRKPLVMLFLSFWLLYFARLASSTIFENESLRSSPLYFWVWGVGVSFLPAISILMGVNKRSLTKIKWPLLVVCMYGNLLAVLTAGTVKLNSLGNDVDIGRLNVESLNPISMGHLGVTAILLGISFLVVGSQSRNEKIAALICIVAGLVVVANANSRGPFVALGACIAILLMSGLRRGGTYVLTLLLGSLVAIYLTASQKTLLGFRGILSRFNGIYEMDQSVSSRVLSYHGAIEEFLASPILGSVIEEPRTGFYPHNLLLESLMANGLLGGLIITSLLFICLRQAWLTLKERSEYTWIALISMQYIFASMFSGGIVGMYSMWVMMALLLATIQYTHNGSISPARSKTIGSIRRKIVRQEQ